VIVTETRGSKPFSCADLFRSRIADATLTVFLGRARVFWDTATGQMFAGRVQFGRFFEDIGQVERAPAYSKHGGDGEMIRFSGNFGVWRSPVAHLLWDRAGRVSRVG